MSDNIRVAVRVRPFNQREKDRNAKLIIRMENTSTWITDPSTNEEKQFTFDYSYWSHNPADHHFANQIKVFADLGSDCLKNAWEGYNVSLFAYGQTGSGKSYSMVGWGDRDEDRGVIPRMYAEIFRRIESNDDPNRSYHVQCSLIEIYNEKVRDLLNPNGSDHLKVREDPKSGPYVEGCSSLVVHSATEIAQLMDEGTRARTIGSTNMNATSSRAHTIFTVVLKQTLVDTATMKAADRTCRMNLVDLAGSERQSATGAAGDRLKEGCFINKSLSTLGNCISALADTGKDGKRGFVPYRDSTLTWLLKESLGGNARTVMIAALSPADINFEETLSTLRYADRAKQIKNRALVNEDPNLLLIRALREEIERLKRGGTSPTGGNGDMSNEEVERLRLQLMESQRIIDMMKGSGADDVTSAERRHALLSEDGHFGEGDVSTTPHMTNLNDDQQLSEKIKYFFKVGETSVGRKKRATDGTGSGTVDFQLSGLGIQSLHCKFIRDNKDRVYIESGSPAAKTYVNGAVVKDRLLLQNHDRIIIGNNHVFKFVYPGAPVPDTLKDITVDWEWAQNEYQEKQGLKISVADDSVAQQKLDEIQREKEAELGRMREAFEAEQRRLQEEVQRAGAAGQAELERRQAEMERRNRQLEEALERQKRVSEELVQRKERAALEHTLLEEQLMKIIPMVHEANEMSRELKKETIFEVKLRTRSLQVDNIVEDLPQELRYNRETEVCVLVTYQFLDNAQHYWTHDKFCSSRIYLMRELYQAWVESQESGTPLEGWDESNDPFFDEIDVELIGTAMCYLESLAMNMDVELSIPILDFKGQGKGELQVAIVPCSATGATDSDDLPLFETDDEALGQETHYEIRVDAARGLPREQCRDCRVQYKFFGDSEYRCTPSVNRESTSMTMNPNFGYRERIHIPRLTRDVLDWFHRSALAFEVWGRQKTSQEVLQKRAGINGGGLTISVPRPSSSASTNGNGNGKPSSTSTTKSTTLPSAAVSSQGSVPGGTASPRVDQLRRQEGGTTGSSSGKPTPLDRGGSSTSVNSEPLTPSVRSPRDIITDMELFKSAAEGSESERASAIAELKRQFAALTAEAAVNADRLHQRESDLETERARVKMLEDQVSKLKKSKSCCVL